MPLPPAGDSERPGALDQDDVRRILHDAAKAKSEPARIEADDAAASQLRDAEIEANRIVSEAELRAEKRSNEILAAAQTQLDAILDEQREAQRKLRRALDDVEQALAGVPRDSGAKADAPVAAAEASNPSPAPRAAAPAATRSATTDNELVNVIAATIRQKVTASH